MKKFIIIISLMFLFPFEINAYDLVPVVYEYNENGHRSGLDFVIPFTATSYRLDGVRLASDNASTLQADIYICKGTYESATNYNCADKIFTYYETATATTESYNGQTYLNYLFSDPPTDIEQGASYYITIQISTDPQALTCTTPCSSIGSNSATMCVDDFANCTNWFTEYEVYYYDIPPPTSGVDFTFPDSLQTVKDFTNFEITYFASTSPTSTLQIMVEYKLASSTAYYRDYDIVVPSHDWVNWAILKTHTLTDGTYNANVYLNNLYNCDPSGLMCAYETLSSTTINFYIDSIAGDEQFTVFPQDEDLGFWGNLFKKLFVPSNETMDKYNTLANLVKSKPPFSYITQSYSFINDIEQGTPALTIPETEITTFLKNTFTIAISMLAVFYAIKRLKSINV